MAFDGFLNIDGIKGEGTDNAHKETAGVTAIRASNH